MENLENDEDINRKKEIRELLELSSKKRKSLQEILVNISEGEENFNLIKNGAVISEYTLTTKALSRHFPKRKYISKSIPAITGRSRDSYEYN